MKLAWKEAFDLFEILRQQMHVSLKQKPALFESLNSSSCFPGSLHSGQGLRNMDFITKCKINFGFSICRMVRSSPLKMFRRKEVLLSLRQAPASPRAKQESSCSLFVGRRESTEEL